MTITVKASTYEAFLKIKALGLTDDEMKALADSLENPRCHNHCGENNQYKQRQAIAING
jgi:hypothetical protein